MKHHILSIGLTKYQLPAANNLKFAAKDAEEFFTLFTQNLTNIGYNKLLVDSEATLAQIRTSLGRELQAEIKTEDTLFIFYSGHGASAINPTDKTLSHYLVPFDATYDIANTGVSVSFIKEALDQINCAAKVMFIDSCFSGSASSKHFPVPTTKFQAQAVKTISNTVSGSGEIVITASKESEESIEDPENKNGLFTHFLLKELQKDNGRQNIPVETLFTPISEAVIKRAKNQFQFTQTPTMNGRLVGGLYLPRFAKQLEYKPEFITLPKAAATALQQIPIPVVKLDDATQEKELNYLISFVVNNQNLPAKIQATEFEKHCKKIYQSVATEWEKIFVQSSGDNSKIPEAITLLETASLQFIMLGNVIASYGSSIQMKTYGYYIWKILKLSEGRAGSVALIAVPKIVLAIIITSIGINCISREDYATLSLLLHQPTASEYDQSQAMPLFLRYDIFYCDALGGYATKVNDHLRDLLKTYKWLEELAPRLSEDETLSYFVQLNLILVVMLALKSESLYPDFGRFEARRLYPLLQRLQVDEELRKKLSGLLKVQAVDVNKVIAKTLTDAKANWQFSSGHWWRSVDNAYNALGLKPDS